MAIALALSPSMPPNSSMPSIPSIPSTPRPRPLQSLRPTTLQRAALVLVTALTLTMISTNVTLLAPLDFMSFRYSPIRDTWRPLLIAHIIYGGICLSYLFAFGLAARRGGWRVRDDVLPTAALSLLGFLLAALYLTVPWYQPLWVQDWECEGLGVPCTVTRLSLAITWPIAALFAAVCLGETIYVVQRHGWGVWHHTLLFLQTVQPKDLVDAQIYSLLPTTERLERPHPLPSLPSLQTAERERNWDAGKNHPPEENARSR